MNYFIGTVAAIAVLFAVVALVGILVRAPIGKGIGRHASLQAVLASDAAGAPVQRQVWYSQVWSGITPLCMGWQSALRWLIGLTLFLALLLYLFPALWPWLEAHDVTVVTLVLLIVLFAGVLGMAAGAKKLLTTALMLVLVVYLGTAVWPSVERWWNKPSAPTASPTYIPSRPVVAATEELKTAECPAQVVRLQLRPGEEVVFNPELKCFPGITIDAGEVCLRLADGSCLNEKAGHQKPSDKRPESMFSKDGARVRYILCPDQTARIKNWTCWPASGLLSGLL